ncbi:helix-turn-helix domain-containing protein [Burkholderia sp. LS-044]|uniref:helix-turn-helix domain-containing protein n=1 Tax=Burkholderia sp. LS-044 TaxID=1459967 RepID=UPI001FFF0D10|nr:helix-turn-helix domain-containing protein [Burkholderia sp. LS-044]
MCTTHQEGFDHLSVIVNAESLHRFVYEWTGRPPDGMISLNLQPMSKVAAAQWNATARSLQQMMLVKPMPGQVAQVLIEHLFKILMTTHPNSHSQSLCLEHYADERRTYSAINMVKSDPMQWNTLGRIARELRCTTGALEKGIRRMTGLGFAEIFYEARLCAVNRALSAADNSSFIDALQTLGFSLSGRFIRDYIRRFGEPPSVTYRRNPNANTAESGALGGHDALCGDVIDLFIDQSLHKPIGLADIAKLIGMREQDTIKAFRAYFAKTPMQYVITRRLERASWLLQNTSASIMSIAIDCGFGTQSYLTTAMKKYLGTTPRQVRIGGIKLPRGATEAIERDLE